jgi:carboxymethylenebutenolidase
MIETDNPRQNVTFESDGGTAHGYLATPPAGAGPGVVVVQEWWGLDDHIVDVCDRLAAEGFITLAPDLYGGRLTHEANEAAEMMARLPVEQATEQLGGAVDYLLDHEAVTSYTVGAVGFCMGGGFVLWLAAQHPGDISVAVPFYGVGPAVPDAYQEVSAVVRGHYAEQDTFYPVAEARALEQQIRAEAEEADVEFFYYPAGHAFHNDQNHLGTYDADAAALAWSRTVDALRDGVS